MREVIRHLRRAALLNKGEGPTDGVFAASRTHIWRVYHACGKGEPCQMSSPTSVGIRALRVIT